MKCQLCFPRSPHTYAVMRAVCNFESALWAFLSVVTWKLGIHSLALVRLETLKWFFLLCCCFFSFFFQMTSFLQWRWMKVFSFAFKLSFSLPPLSLISESFFIYSYHSSSTYSTFYCLSPPGFNIYLRSLSFSGRYQNVKANRGRKPSGGLSDGEYRRYVNACVYVWMRVSCLFGYFMSFFFSLSLYMCICVRFREEWFRLQ